MDIKSIKAQQFINDIEKNKRKKADAGKFKKELDATKSEKADKLMKNEDIKLSAKSEEVKDARKVVDSAPDVRWDVVNDIKARIAAGTYKVDSEALAEKFINTGLYKNLFE